MEKMSFEQAIARIDEIVKNAREGATRRSSSRCRLFEEGTKLIKFCGKLSGRRGAEGREAPKGRGRRSGRDCRSTDAE